MQFRPLAIEGAFVIEPESAEDERGAFARIFCAETFKEKGLAYEFNQRSISFNLKAGTLRGMHFQKEPHAETKIVRCTAGAIIDVVLDLRRESSSFRRWVAVEIDASNRRSIYIPQGCAHGFLTLQDATEVYYEITPDFTPAAAAGVRWDDPAFQIGWPSKPVIIGEKDRNWPLFGLEH